jgi:ketosteroid isomerase-like protein
MLLTLRQGNHSGSLNATNGRPGATSGLEDSAHRADTDRIPESGTIRINTQLKQEIQEMKWLVISIVFAFVGVGVSAAQPPKASQDPADIAAIKQISQDMGDAMVRVDIDKLNQIYADDFVTVGRSGNVITKADLLTNFQSFHDKLESFENGPIDVQVFGNVAVANGSVTEKRIRDGKSADGVFLWMDLLEKRDGRWQVVRSAGSRIK